MAIPSAYDRERLVYINSLMDSIHELTNNIYESLVDGDIKKLNEDVSSLTLILAEINPSDLGDQ
jgi:hypothetical protein